MVLFTGSYSNQDPLWTQTPIFTPILHAIFGPDYHDMLPCNMISAFILEGRDPFSSCENDPTTRISCTLSP